MFAESRELNYNLDRAT